MDKIAIISDIHFGARRNNTHFLVSAMGFFNNELKPYLIKNNIKDIFILGDLFDNRESINVKISNAVFHLFEDDLKDFNITILLGNHDIFYKTSDDIHSLKFLNKLDNVTVIDKMKTIKINKKKFLLTPWLTNRDDFVNKINLQKFRGCDVCFGHFDISGFNLNSFIISQDGIESQKFFDSFKLTFSGHYHTRSYKKIGDSEIMYVGSPYHLDRSDIGTDRGFHILNTNDLSYEFIKSETTIKYLKYQYPCIIDIDDIENNILDIHVTVNNEYDETIFNEFIREIEEFKPLSVNFFPNYHLSDTPNIEQFKGKTITELLTDWINRNVIQNDNLPQELKNETNIYVQNLIKKSSGEY